MHWEFIDNVLQVSFPFHDSKIQTDIFKTYSVSKFVIAEA